MRFIELFAGIGGFRRGLEMADPGYDCVWANEWDRYASSIYKYKYRSFSHGAIDTRDIRSVEARDIPRHDLLTAGFPCQAFSVSGKHGGFEDTRGTLFFEIARILQHHRPGHILLENVAGLPSHDGGKTIQRMFGILSELGYRIEWQVLNSKRFGIPQDRRRVFITGHLRRGCGRKIFPIMGSPGKDLDELTSDQSEATRIYNPAGVAKTLKAEAGGQGAKTGLYAVVKNHGQLKIRPDDLSTTLVANYWKGLDNHQSRTGVLDVRDGQIRVRRLTPVECERLQGYPDNYTRWGMEDSRQVPISDTQRYKCLGNTVTINVIEAIGKRLIQCRKDGRS